MEDHVEIIKSNKGGMKVIHKGYMYTVHKKRQCGGIRWRCAQRSLHCKGSISTGAEGPPKVNMPHNHLPDLHSVALARGRQADDFAPVTQFLDVKFEEDAGTRFEFAAFFKHLSFLSVDKNFVDLCGVNGVRGQSQNCVICQKINCYEASFRKTRRNF